MLIAGFFILFRELSITVTSKEKNLMIKYCSVSYKKNSKMFLYTPVYCFTFHIKSLNLTQVIIKSLFGKMVYSSTC